MRLHLVRHGRPVVDPASPASQWPLAPGATGQVDALAASGVLPSEARWFSSAEPKAVQTARRLHPTGEVTAVADLAEARRGAGWLGGENFERAVRRAFSAPELSASSGWEPLSATRGRVTSAARAAVREAAAARQDVVLVGHGTAWALLVAELTSGAPDVEAWWQLLMPDHWAFDLTTSSVASAWGAWRAAPAGPSGPWPSQA